MQSCSVRCRANERVFQREKKSTDYNNGDDVGRVIDEMLDETDSQTIESIAVVPLKTVKCPSELNQDAQHIKLNARLYSPNVAG